MDTADNMRHYKNNNNTKLYIIVKIALLDIIFSLIVWVAEYYSIPKLKEQESLVNPISLMNNATMTTDGYKIFNDNSFYLDDSSKTSDHPKIVFTNIDSSFRTIEIRFKENLGDGIPIKVNYQEDNGKSYNSHTLIGIGSNDKRIYIFNFPTIARKTLKIEINGEFKLDDVSISKYAPVIKKQPHPNMNIALLAYLLIINLIIIITMRSAYYKIRNDICISDNIIGNIQSATRIIAICIILSIASLAILYIYAAVLNIHIYSQQRIFTILSAALLTCIICMRNKIKSKLEFVYALIAVYTGILFIVLSGTTGFLTFDDDIHYPNALAISYGGERIETRADIYISKREAFQDYSSEKNDRISENLLNSLYKEGAMEVRDMDNYYSIQNLGYIPTSLGMLTGRVLHLHFAEIYQLGRIYGLIFYVILTVLGIRQLKAGKMLAIAISLLPINIYQACNYTYDSWIYSWIMYGLCRYLGFIQNEREKFCYKEIFSIALCILIGSCPKPVYAALLAVLLYIPIDKYASRKQIQTYYLLITGCSVIVIIMAYQFAIPYLSTITDPRGGLNVDSSQQISYLINNPGEYISTSLKFIFREYLTISNNKNYLTCTAYFPSVTKIEGPIYSFPGADIWQVLILYIAVTSYNGLFTKPTSNVEYIIVKILLLAGSMLSIYLTVTILYIGFNPVGSKTIEGCQGRYLEPVLLPMFFCLTPKKKNFKYSNSDYLAEFLIITILIFAGMGYNAFLVVKP